MTSMHINDEQTEASESGPGSEPVAEPFFIVGFQRSGTTLLRMMLNEHPLIAIPHDSAELWPKYRGRVGQYNALRDSDDAVRMIEDLLHEPRIKAWGVELSQSELLASPLPRSFGEVMARFHEVYARARGKRVWGDKNTGTLVELDELNALFPSARFVHLIRDGRDCALSHVGSVYTYGYENVLRVAEEWRDQVGLCRKMGRMLPRDRFLEVRYEDLVTAPSVVLEQICRFLGVDYSDQMLRYHEHVADYIPKEKQSLWPLINRPPEKDNLYKWMREMSAADRAIFERVAADLLRIYGYETQLRPATGGRARELWYRVHQRIAWRLKKLKSNKKGK